MGSCAQDVITARQHQGIIRHSGIIIYTDDTLVAQNN